LGDWTLKSAAGHFNRDFLTVIDDHNLNVTHVLRGEDQKEALARQLLIYQAFDWQLPIFAHIPLLLATDKTLLSPKKDTTTLTSLKAEGYLPHALINYLGLLGWAIPDLRKVFLLKELSDRFTIEEMSRVSAVFDWDKLKNFNAHYLKQLSIDAFIQELKALSPQVEKVTEQRGADWLLTSAQVLQQHVHTLREAVTIIELVGRSVNQFDEEAKKVLANKDTVQILKIVQQLLPEFEEFTAENVPALIHRIKDKIESKFKNPYTPLRAALSGSTQTHELVSLLVVLGKQECQNRVEYALKNLQHARKK